MKPSIDTLVDDIYAVVDGAGGWGFILNQEFKEGVGSITQTRLNPTTTSGKRKPTLRMSNIGTDCERKLWYELNSPSDSSYPSHLGIRFLMGDLVEELLLALATAAGHEVTGQQDTIEVDGIVGHRDAVIDGVTVDVKSASASNFNKFKNDTLSFDDPYGYVRQLNTYVVGAKDDPLVEDKEMGAFLVMNINTGELVLNKHRFDPEQDDTSNFIEKIKGMVAEDTPPPRPYVDDEQKNGNWKLNKKCTFCQHKKECVPSLRSFEYSGFVQHFTYLESVPHGKEEIGYD